MCETFELYKYYQHCGGSKIHIIAETEISDMYHISPGKKMLIAETIESGDLYCFKSDNSKEVFESKELNIKKELYDYPTEEFKLRPIDSSTDGAVGWFEISKDIFLSISKERKITITPQTLKVPEEKIIGKYYSYILFIYYINSRYKFYLLNTLKYRNRLIIPNVSNNVSDILKELENIPEEHFLSIQATLFKYT